jgi:DNA polymerase-3 subunit delta
VQEFQQLAPWDTDGLVAAVKAAAKERQLKLAPAATELLAEAVGTDRRRLAMELDKLALFAVHQSEPVTPDQVAELVPASAYTSFQLATQLRQGHTDKALQILTHLLDSNEPALKIVAVLVGQFRLWLWVKLMAEAGERDPKAIAKAAEIGNPNRVYFLQKEVRSLSSRNLYRALELLLDLEYRLKRGQEERRTLQVACVQITSLQSGG